MDNNPRCYMHLWCCFSLSYISLFNQFWANCDSILINFDQRVSRLVKRVKWFVFIRKSLTICHLFWSNCISEYYEPMDNQKRAINLIIFFSSQSNILRSFLFKKMWTVPKSGSSNCPFCGCLYLYICLTFCRIYTEHIWLSFLLLKNISNISLTSLPSLTSLHSNNCLLIWWWSRVVPGL